MELLHESKFSKIGFDETNSIMICQWLGSTDKMKADQYMEEMSQSTKLKSPKYLIDLRDFKFSISPDVQTWTNETVFPQYIQSGLKKVAFVNSSDIFAQVSIEQMFEVSHFESKFFDDVNQAKEWLRN